MSHSAKPSPSTGPPPSTGPTASTASTSSGPWYKKVPLPITEPERKTNKRVYWSIDMGGKKIHLKRNLVPSEFQISSFTHQVVAWSDGANRLRNEKLAMDYVRENTCIPVPNVLFYLDEGDRVYLGTEHVSGVQMGDIKDPEKRLKVIEQLDAMVKELETHRSSTIRGFGVHPCFPYYVPRFVPECCAPKRYVENKDEGYPLCHGDVHEGNVLVDPKTLKITAVLDWEYAGYYPAEVDVRRYKFGEDFLERPDGTTTRYDEYGPKEYELLKSLQLRR